MLTHGMLFILGFLSVLLVGYFADRPSSRAGLYVAPAHYSRRIFWILIAIGGVLLLFLSLEAMTYAFSLRDVLLGEWLVMGRGYAILCGAVAGLVASAGLKVLETLQGDRSAALLAALTTSPALIVAMLFFVSIAPELMTRYGIGGIETSVFKLSFSAVSTAAQQSTRMPGLVTAQTGARNGDKMGPEHYWPLYDITKYGGTSYFIRQGLYLRDYDNVLLEGFGKNKVPTEEWAAAAIDRQRKLLRALEPLIHCGGLYRDRYAAIQGLDRIFGPVSAALLDLDAQLQQIAGQLLEHPKQTVDWSRLDALEGKLVERVEAAHKTLMDALQLQPSGPQYQGQPSVEKCHQPIVLPRSFKDGSPVDPPQSYRITPPYLVIFVANLYQAHGNGAAALRLMNNWFETHPRAPEAGRDQLGGLVVLRAHAELRYTLLQSDIAPSIFADAAMRDNLRTVRENLAKDWHIDLRAEGVDCTKKDPSKEPIRARALLALPYSDLVMRLLNAIVDARSVQEGDLVNGDHKLWAEELSAFADRCVYVLTSTGTPPDETLQLAAEPEDDHQERAGMLLLAAGRVLARWSIDGPKQGLLPLSEVSTVRTLARTTLQRALPHLRHTVMQYRSEEVRQAKGRTFRIGEGVYEPYQRQAEQEILELDALLGR